MSEKITSKTAAKTKRAAGSGTQAKPRQTAAVSKAAAVRPPAKKAKKPPLKRPALKDLDDEFGLKLFFQPVFEPDQNRIYGYECLLRIIDPELGTITPDVFLSVAQKNASLMKGLEEWSLAEIFRTAKVFREHKKYIDMLSLNIDTENFFKKDFYDKVAKYLEKITENIYFELKEDAFFSDDPVVKETLVKLRDAGIKIAVDDFTANFLTFDWGESLPFDMIKIDRAYIDRFMTSPKARLIVEKIIKFADERQLELVAVGVETREQEAELIKMGCRKMQGYLYSKPLQIKKLLTETERTTKGDAQPEITSVNAQSGAQTSDSASEKES